MNDPKILTIIIFSAAFIALILIICLIKAVYSRQKISNNYADHDRGIKFATSLLTAVFKDKIVKNPYVLQKDYGIPKKADCIFIGSGGIAVITVQEGSGAFIAPEKSEWRCINANGNNPVPNLIERGQYYVAAIADLVHTKDLFCPAIIQYVFVTDDDAIIDYMSDPRVLNGSDLIDELKNFDADKVLSSREQKKLLSAIMKNHSFCQTKDAEGLAQKAERIAESQNKKESEEQMKLIESAEGDEIPEIFDFSDLEESLEAQDADTEAPAEEATDDEGEENEQQTLI
ncbi:MAG: hypothetical protein J5850_00400 [Clostridia bacterium]|nr:hypothetical protein [Clostridia bacterium]